MARIAARTGTLPAWRSTIRSHRSTTRGAGPSSRTSASTSTRRGDSGGPVVELAVGTGRIAVPVAQAGHPRDRRRPVRAGCSPWRGRSHASAASSELVDLRVGRPARAARRRARPARDLPVPLAAAHARRGREAAALCGRRATLLEPGGRLVFDVFAPSTEDIAETDGRWLEREPGIFERADWDQVSPHPDALGAWRRVGRDDEPALALGARVAAPARRWQASRSSSTYGWFDRRPYDGGEDSIWVCRRRG